MIYASSLVDIEERQIPSPNILTLPPVNCSKHSQRLLCLPPIRSWRLTCTFGDSQNPTPTLPTKPLRLLLFPSQLIRILCTSARKTIQTQQYRRERQHENLNSRRETRTQTSDDANPNPNPRPEIRITIEDRAIDSR